MSLTPLQHVLTFRKQQNTQWWLKQFQHGSVGGFKTCPSLRMLWNIKSDSWFRSFFSLKGKLDFWSFLNHYHHSTRAPSANQSITWPHALWIFWKWSEISVNHCAWSHVTCPIAVCFSVRKANSFILTEPFNQIALILSILFHYFN